MENSTLENSTLTPINNNNSVENTKNTSLGTLKINNSKISKMLKILRQIPNKIIVDKLLLLII